MSAKPDFLLIGPPRTASTWLAANLAHNPRIWMPPVKELHYFDVQKTGPLNNRYRDLHYEQLRNRRKLSSAEFDAVLAEHPNSWANKYLNAPRDDAWYASLFDAEDQISGEATPTYIRLKQSQIEEVFAVTPEVKIVLTMRHPLFRILSLIGKMLRDTGDGSPSFPEDRLANLVSSNSRVYVANMKRWERSVPRERRLLIWYEDISRDGAAVLTQVSDFLGASDDSGWERMGNVDRPINVSPSWNPSDLPENIKRLIANSLTEEMEFLCKRYPARTRQWSKKLEHWLADAPGTSELG